MSYRETEIKLPIADPSAVRSRLEALGAKVKKERHFEDNRVLDLADHRLRTNGKLLRLRVTGDGSNSGLLTFKGRGKISDGTKDREEVECTVSDPDHLIRIFEELGFKESFRYQKYRTVYRIDRVELEFCVDETPIGNFVELEGDIEQIHVYAEKLGFQRSQYITDSYSMLYLKWCHDHNIQPSHMIFS